MKVVMEPMPSGIGPGEAPDVFSREMQATFPDVHFVEVGEEADQIQRGSRRRGVLRLAV